MVAISWRLVRTACGLKREKKKKERDGDRGQEREREDEDEDVKMYSRPPQTLSGKTQGLAPESFFAHP